MFDLSVPTYVQHVLDKDIRIISIDNEKTSEGVSTYVFQVHCKGPKVLDYQKLSP